MAFRSICNSIIMLCLISHHSAPWSYLQQFQGCPKYVKLITYSYSRCSEHAFFQQLHIPVLISDINTAISLRNTYKYPQLDISSGFLLLFNVLMLVQSKVHILKSQELQQWQKSHCHNKGTELHSASFYGIETILSEVKTILFCIVVFVMYICNICKIFLM